MLSYDSCGIHVRIYEAANSIFTRTWLRYVRVFAIANPSVCCLPSVTFVCPTQPVEIFGNVSMPFCTLAKPSTDLHAKYYGQRIRGSTTMCYINSHYITEIVSVEPLCRGLNTRGVAKYSDFVPVEGYISETVQDTASGAVNSLTNRKA